MDLSSLNSNFYDNETYLFMAEIFRSQSIKFALKKIKNKKLWYNKILSFFFFFKMKVDNYDIF